MSSKVDNVAELRAEFQELAEITRRAIAVAEAAIAGIEQRDQSLGFWGRAAARATAERDAALLRVSELSHAAGQVQGMREALPHRDAEIVRSTAEAIAAWLDKKAKCKDQLGESYINGDLVNAARDIRALLWRPAPEGSDPSDG